MPVPTIIPMSLLEALRNLDTPVEDGLEEVAGEIVSKRLGLSPTVAAQIARYQDATRRGDPVSVDEAVGVFRLAGRRPDAPLVFADGGRRVARYAARLAPFPVRALIRVGPSAMTRGIGARTAARLARRILEVDLMLHEHHAEASAHRTLSVLALPDGSACGYYAAAVNELLRLLTGFEGAMLHEECRAQGGHWCRWRGTQVGGYD